MNAEGVLGGIFMPGDGAANPSDLTRALAKGARMNGARIFEHTVVEEVLTQGGRVSGVRTSEGTISTGIVVNCGGMWARELGQRNGVGGSASCVRALLPRDRGDTGPADGSAGSAILL